MNDRKKNSRQRGTHTHGWGSKKKHRGAGHRGGRGAAGSGKRGDAKKPSIWKNTRYAGKRGFSSKNTTTTSPITLHHLTSYKKTLMKEGTVTQDKDAYSANLEKSGFTKLIAKGQVHEKWHITISTASPKAIEKIKKAGGTVTLTAAPTEKPAEE